MTIIYYSGTGNSLHVAKSISDNCIHVSQLIQDNNYEIKDDCIGIVFPCFALSIPKTLRDYLKKAKFECDYLFGLVTYGGKAGGATLLLESYHKFNYTNTIQMTDNYLPMYDMDEAIEKGKTFNTEEKIASIKEDIQNRKEYKHQADGPKFLSKVGGFGLDRMLKSYDKKFDVMSNCTLCKSCARVCPRNNITITNKVTYNGKCDACLGCIHICPVNAIHMMEEKSNTRYINENIAKSDLFLR